MPRRTIEQTFAIDAPIDAVWETLTRVDDYARWNPFVTGVQSPQPGTTVGVVMKFSVRFHDDSTATSNEQVTVVEPPAANADGHRRAMWVYSFRSWMSTIGMIRSVRSQELRQAPGGPTVYMSSIQLSGWGAAGAPLGKIARGLQDQAEALQSTVEAAKA